MVSQEGHESVFLLLTLNPIYYQGLFRDHYWDLLLFPPRPCRCVVYFVWEHRGLHPLALVCKYMSCSYMEPVGLGDYADKVTSYLVVEGSSKFKVGN